MISESHAVAQFARLSSLNSRKAIGKPEIREYLRVTKSAARSDYQVAAAVTRWIDTQTFPPSPAELRAMIEASAASAPATDGDCRECNGSGRRSFWALITIDRWPDSGNVRSRKVEKIPVEGDPNLWLLSWPPLAKQVDGRNQIVETLSGFCRCGFGQRLKQAKAAAREA